MSRLIERGRNYLKRKIKLEESKECLRGSQKIKRNEKFIQQKERLVQSVNDQMIDYSEHQISVFLNAIESDIESID